MEILFDSITLNLALAAGFLIVCFYFYSTATFNYWKDRGVPYAKPTPFLGGLIDQLIRTKSLVELVGNIHKELKGHKYGGFFDLRTPSLMIMDPELVERVLIKDFTHFYNRGFPFDKDIDPLNANLFNLEDDVWRNLRYKLTPTFTTGKLKGMFEQICNCGDGVIKYIEEETETNKPIENLSLVGNFTLDVIASCAFGLQMDPNNELNKNFRKAVKEVFSPSGLANLKQFLIFYSPKLAKLLRIKGIPIRAETTIMTIVKETLKFREEKKINRNDFIQLLLNLQKQEQNAKFEPTIDQDHYPEDDVIDQLKHAGNNVEVENENGNKKAFFTDSIIAAQSFIFLAGGSETVSSTIGFCLFCLAQNPHIQKKVHEEIDSVLEKYSNQWSYQVVKELNYLEQVIQETLRMYPVIPLLFRICTQEYKIPGSNVILEKGARLLIPTFQIHHDPKNYESPEIFNPDRFVNNNFKPSGSFLPFGDGPRICIAMRFAALELKVVLARIMSQYTVKLNEKTQLPFKYQANSFLLSAVGGLWFDFSKRAKI